MVGLLKDRQSELEGKYSFWRPATLSDLFFKVAWQYPTHDFIVARDKTYSYEAAAEMTLITVKALVLIGVKKGDHVALSLNNCPQYVFLTLALSCIGAVKVSVNAKLAAPGMKQILDHSDSKYLFISEDNRSLSELKEHYKCFPIGSSNTAWLSEIYASLQGKCKEVSMAAMLYTHISPDDFADLFYTSGSTGEPKGVLLTHDMLLRSAYASCLNRGFEFGRRIYVPLPLYHVYGYVEGLLTAIFVAGSILIDDSKFDPGQALSFMAEARANDILSVPTMMMDMIDHMNGKYFDLSPLHAAYCSASVCPEWLWTRIREEFQVNDVITGYGMTEMCGASMQTSPLDGDDILTKKVGKILYGGISGRSEWNGRQIKFKCVDENGYEVPSSVCGQLLCKGDTVTKGYYKNQSAIEEAFTSDGWFKTGDIGRFDENGYLELNGRSNDMYRINGENTSPKFIESEIIKCSVVKYVEVVGVPSPRYGEVGVAFVELWEDTGENRNEVVVYSKNNLGSFQIPYRFFFVTADMWPCTSTGKVQKHKLRKLAIDSLDLPELKVYACTS